MKILLAHADPSIGETLSSRLEQWDDEVVGAQEAKEALAALSGGGIAMAILADSLTDMSGVDLCRQMRETDQAAYLYIILLTGTDDKNDRVTGYAAGADACVPGPPDMEELEALINSGRRVAGLQFKGADDETASREKAVRESESAAHLINGIDLHAADAIEHQDRIMAKIAFSSKLVDKRQLAEAFSQQHRKRQEGLDPRLDEVLMDMGAISTEKAEELRSAGKRREGKRFGEMAVTKGYTTKDRVEEALDIQAREYKDTRTCRRVDEILLALGYLNAEQCEEVNRDQEKKNRPKAAFASGEGSETGEGTSAESVEETPEEIPPDISVTVSPGGLEALLYIPAVPGRKRLAVADVKEALKRDEVIFGIVPDEQIQAYLTGESEASWVVATAQASKPGKDAEVKYHFDPEYLRAGTIDADGSIDFRDRGEVPRVKEGDVLAEKIPMIPGEDGVDIFGRPIRAEAPEDTEILCESNVTLSDDGSQAIAAIDGQPHVTVSGKLSVFSNLTIDSDVDYHTGNIIFDGNIHIKGSVQDGFLIKGGDVHAEQIMGATVHAKGNVIVNGGIQGAVIQAEGVVVAKYIHRANIKAYGDVSAAKEIIDSKIRTSSQCIVKSGKFISSLVAAREGMTVKDIGTDFSSPCTLKIGSDDHIRKIVQGFDRSSEDFKDDLKKMQTKYEALMAKQGKGNAENGNGAQPNGTDVKPPEAPDVDGPMGGELLELYEKMSVVINTIERMNTEKQSVVKWSQNRKQQACIKVSGLLHAGTKILSPNASLVLKETARNITVREAVAEHDNQYELRMER